MSSKSRSSYNNNTTAADRRINARRLDLAFLRGPRFNYDVDDRICWCNPPSKAPMWLSWTDANPRRRFFNCPNEPKNEKRKYFEWFDDPFPPRAIEVVNYLRREKSLYQNQFRRLINNGCEHFHFSDRSSKGGDQ